MKIRQHFAGFKHGDEVMGTIMLFRLSARQLLERNIIHESHGTYVYGPEKKHGPGKAHQAA